MRQTIIVTLALVLTSTVWGCRTATQVTEVPRVDLQLEGGNRGFLLGTPPPAREAKTTRQMVETTIEVPSFYKTKQPASTGSVEDLAPPETEPYSEDGASREGASTKSNGPAVFDVYVVQKGESLWSIAEKKEIYGKATQWRKIFDANRDLLKSPNRIRAGMRLKIPRGADAKGATTYGDEGEIYKK